MKSRRAFPSIVEYAARSGVEEMNPGSVIYTLPIWSDRYCACVCFQQAIVESCLDCQTRRAGASSNGLTAPPRCGLRQYETLRPKQNSSEFRRETVAQSVL